MANILNLKEHVWSVNSFSGFFGRHVVSRSRQTERDRRLCCYTSGHERLVDSVFECVCICVYTFLYSFYKLFVTLDLHVPTCVLLYMHSYSCLHLH